MKWPLSVYGKQAEAKERILAVSNVSGIGRYIGTESLAGDALVSAKEGIAALSIQRRIRNPFLIDHFLQKQFIIVAVQ